MLQLAGILAANGGGGGGGAGRARPTSPVRPAKTASHPPTAVATGGPGSTDRAGGNGGTGTTAPVTPAGNNNNAGGGGGAVGYIWLRTHGTPAATASSRRDVLSPELSAARPLAATAVDHPLEHSLARIDVINQATAKGLGGLVVVQGAAGSQYYTSSIAAS